MPIAIIEQRLKLAQTALAYIQNILEQDHQRFISERVYLSEHSLTVEIEVLDKMSLFSALHEIQWHMDIDSIHSWRQENKLYYSVKVRLEDECQS